MFTWIVISVVIYVHQRLIKATTLFILTWLFGICMVARQLQKTGNGLILSLKFFFGKQNKLK